jgi:nitroreductase
MAEKELLNELIRRRWSPTTFAERAVHPAILESLFEAARWAASCFNEQPWRFIIATRGDPAEFERILALLAPKNQAWASSAFALGVTAGKKTFSHNGAPDRFGLHDAGAALANLMVQATFVGLHVHAMGGFDAVRTRSEFSVPEDFEMGAAFAIGYVEGPAEPPATRSRRPLSQLVFSGRWEQPAFGE